MSRIRIRSFLYGSRAFSPLRSIYQSIFDHQRLKVRRERRNFYRHFILPKDLVFDIGANVGTYAETFAELGARVIAVEPDPACWDSLSHLAKMKNVVIERYALGASPGVINFHLGSASICSTAVPRLATTSRGNREVPVLTLNQLSEMYGLPNFVKIDCEGFDDQVLQGMSFFPRSLSFEYLLYYLGPALCCLKTLDHSGYEFNYIRGDNYRMMGEWVTASVMSQQLEALSGNPQYGDVFARRK